MFTANCPRHGRRVLLTADSIERMTRRRDGFDVAYRCTCGHRGTTFVARTRRSGPVA